MRIFSNFSIKHKIVFIVLFATFIAVGIGFTFTILSDISLFREEARNNAIMQARLIAEYSVPTLLFEDKEGAVSILEKIKEIPSNIAGGIYNTDGKLFVLFKKTNSEVIPEKLNSLDESYFDGESLIVHQPIKYHDQRYGTIYLKSSTHSLSMKINSYLQTMAIFLFGLMIVVYLLALGLQKFISKPILNLADLSRKISQAGDYSIRIEKTGKDEIGQLYDEFNNMLQQIEKKQKERDESENALRESESRIKKLVEISPIPMVINDSAGEASMINAKFSEVFGYDIQDVLHIENWWLLAYPDTVYREEVKNEWDKRVKVAMQNQSEMVPMESVVTCKNGSKKIIEFRLSSMGGKNFIVLSDLTELKNIETELKAHNESLSSLLRLNQMLDASKDKIEEYTFNEAIRLTQSEIGYLGYMNQDETVMEVSFWSKNVLPECKIPDKTILFPLENAGLWAECIRQRKAIITNNYSAPNPLKKGTPPGHVEITRHINIPVIFNSKIRLIAGVGNKKSDYTETDVKQLTLLMEGMWYLNERIEISEKIRKLNLDLENRVKERTVQLEAVGKELSSFSYSISHDLRSPLRSIDGFSKAILEDYGNILDGQAHDYLNRVRAASQRMGDLLDDIITLTGVSKEGVHKETINLSEIAEKIISKYKMVDQNRDVEFIVTPNLEVQADPGLMEISLQNILGNSWKFTAKHPKARIEFGVITEGGKLVYFVKDDGVGFDMAYADKLFNAFQRMHTTAEYEGTGIGLATVHRIISLHGGKVWIESAIEKGTTLYFTLF
jgi:PAS domain S-box-containing protein